MRFTNIITGLILLSSWLTTKGGSFTEIASNTGGLGYLTNFAVGLSITSALSDFGKHPIAIVHLSNNRVGNFAANKTNCDWFLNMPSTNLFSVELYDLSGKPVGKTKEGLQFGLPLTSQQIEDWNYQMMSHRDGARLCMICPHDSRQVGVISIRENFEIKQAGEYILHLRMRLIMNMQYAWLPETTGKVLIRPEDILPPGSPQVGGVNMPTK